VTWPFTLSSQLRNFGRHAAGGTPRIARCTRRSHNTHSGSSLSSSSLRGDDLHTVDTTEQVPGLGGGATRALLPTDPNRPALLAARGTALTPDPTRHNSPGWPRMRPTHAHGRAGGCCVLWVRQPATGSALVPRTRSIAAPTSEGISVGKGTRAPLRREEREEGGGAGSFYASVQGKGSPEDAFE